jgi:hypothetical protein
VRFPSQQLLDPGGPLSETVKTGVADALEDKFGIKKEKLAVNQKANKEQDGFRNDAFFLARHFLVAAKEAAYVEQYEGMYALTRGLAAAFGMAAVYYLGWALSFLGGDWTSQAAYIAIAAGLIVALLSTIALVAQKKSIFFLEWLAGSALLLAALAMGFGIGHSYDKPRLHALLLLLALAALLASWRAYRFYKEFTITFAVTVWRDFFVAGRKKAAPSADKQLGNL